MCAYVQVSNIEKKKKKEKNILHATLFWFSPKPVHSQK